MVDLRSQSASPAQVQGSDAASASVSGRSPATSWAPTPSAIPGASQQPPKRRRRPGVVTPNACTECRKKRAKVCVYISAQLLLALPNTLAMFSSGFLSNSFCFVLVRRSEALRKVQEPQPPCRMHLHGSREAVQGEPADGNRSPAPALAIQQPRLGGSVPR